MRAPACNLAAMTGAYRKLLLLLVTASLPAATAGTAPDAHAESGPPDAIDLALVFGGDVTHGMYQAGFAYFFSETIKRSKGRIKLHLVGGASAGSITATLAALSSCLPKNDDPTRDLGWLMWFDALYEHYDPRIKR